MAAPGGEVLLAGAYTITVNSVALGLFGGDSELPTLDQTTEGEHVGNTSIYAKSVIETFGQGGNWFMSMTCLEYKTGTISSFWPFGAMGVMGVISRAYTAMALPLVMTAVTGTPAQVAGAPNTLTAPLVILAKGFNTKLMYGPTLRKVPLRFQLYPSTISGAVAWFSQT